jgi:hypothetical protein
VSSARLPLLAAVLTASLFPSMLCAGPDADGRDAVRATGFAVQAVLGDRTDKTDRAEQPLAKAGRFVLSRPALAFEVEQHSGAAAQVITLSLNKKGSKKVYAVGAGYLRGGSQPGWLGLSVVPTGPLSFELRVWINATGLAPGTYSNTFDVGTANRKGKVLSSSRVTVTLVVRERLGAALGGIQRSFDYGAATVTDSGTNLVVTGRDRTWQATSTATWLNLPAGPHTGSQTLPIGIDVSGLAPGTHSATVVVRDVAQPSATASVPLAVTVHAPRVQFPGGSVSFGGLDGLGTEERIDLPLSVSTEGRRHPYSVSLTDAGAWLRVLGGTGEVGVSAVRPYLQVDRSSVAPGVHRAQATITVQVLDLEYTHTVDVVLRVEAHRLLVEHDAVAFTVLPGRSVLERELQVRSSLGRDDVVWTASADQAWLTVTGSGSTGSTLRVSADPGGLQAGRTHHGTITVRSTAADVENVQLVSVGLHVRDQAPAAVDIMLPSGARVAASPVAPELFVSAGPDVVVYDLYSGAELRRFSGAVGAGGVLVVRGDGRRVFVQDEEAQHTVELDATSGARVATWANVPRFQTPPTGNGLALVRPGGRLMLVTPTANLYDLATGADWTPAGTSFALPNFSEDLAVAPGGTRLVSHFGAVLDLTHTALDDGPVRAELSEAVHVITGGNPRQTCVRSDGAVAYGASGHPYHFTGTDLANGAEVQILPGAAYPNSIACASNGLVVGGAYVGPSEGDIWVYHGVDGGLRGRLRTANNRLLNRGLVVSADGMRLVSLAQDGYYPSDPVRLRIHDLPPP